MTDLDFGLSTDFESALDSIGVDEEDSCPVREGEMLNPFFTNLDTNFSKTITSDRSTWIDRTLVLCLRKGVSREDGDDSILNRFLSRDQFEALPEKYTLLKGSRYLIYNKVHSSTTIRIPKVFLNGFNHSRFELNNEEAVVMMTNMSEDAVGKYLGTFDKGTSLSDVTELLHTFEYYDSLNNQSAKHGLVDMIASLKEANYFKTKKHCLLNTNQRFEDRVFRYNGTSESALVKKADGGLATLFDRLSKISRDGTDYLKHIDHSTKKYYDGSAVNSGSTLKYYIDPKLPELNKVQMAQIFESLTDEGLRFNLFTSLATSKSHFHLVVNNARILRNMRDIFKKTLSFMRYPFGYAWVYAYLEEGITRTRTTVDSRYVFDINTAHELPYFPFAPTDLHVSPYLPILVDRTLLNADKNLGGIPMIKGHSSDIGTLSGFQTRFNLFTSSKEDVNIFAGLKWKEETSDGVKNVFAVTGSAIPACVPENNPLLVLGNSQGSISDKYRRLYGEYYSTSSGDVLCSDVDVMCNEERTFPYMDRVNELKKVVIANTNKLKGKDVSDTFKVEDVKSLYITVSMDYVKECMLDMIESEYGNRDLTNIKNIFKEGWVIEHFYAKYVENKVLTNTKSRVKHRETKNPLYDHFFRMVTAQEMQIDLVDYDIPNGNNEECASEKIYHLNDFRDDEEQVSEEDNKVLMKISENIRFKITSPNLEHNIEVFRIKYNDFFSCVSRFHLNCVRGFYDGSNVYMLPSCVSALMTRWNMDYHYFSGMRDPIDILNKYRMRGYGTILNDLEKLHVVEYNSTIDKWNGMFAIDKKDRSSRNDHFGVKSLSSDIYKPSKFIDSFPDDVYAVPTCQYVTNDSDVHDEYKRISGYDHTKEGINFLTFKVVDNHGNVEPIKSWVLECAYDKFFN